ASPLMALVRSHADDPRGQGLGLAQLAEMLQRLEADGLEDLRRVFASESVFDRYREDQILVAIDERRPSFFATFATFADEPLLTPRLVLFLSKFDARAHFFQ